MILTKLPAINRHTMQLWAHTTCQTNTAYQMSTDHQIQLITTKLLDQECTWTQLIQVH